MSGETESGAPEERENRRRSGEAKGLRDRWAAEERTEGDGIGSKW